eukprot:Em0001g784a
MMVVTRAGARTQEEEEELRRQKEVTSQVTASPVQLSQEVAESQHSSPEEGGEEEATGESICEERVGGKQSSEPIYNLDDDLFAGGRERHTLTRSQKRIQRRAHQSLGAKCLSGGPLDMSAGELNQLLNSDPSLENLKITGTDNCKTHFYLEEGLLYRRWIPKDCGPDSNRHRTIPKVGHGYRWTVAKDDFWEEVPQTSTGFAPFELLYGRAVRGPLDIVKESWKESKWVKKNVVSYVLGVQEKLAKMSSLAAENLQRDQKQQKLWYDGNARQQEFQIGDLVLVLLPTSAGALTAQWKGPYPILQKIGAANYVVDIHCSRHVSRKHVEAVEHSKRQSIFLSRKYGERG